MFPQIDCPAVFSLTVRRLRTPPKCFGHHRAVVAVRRPPTALKPVRPRFCALVASPRLAVIGHQNFCEIVPSASLGLATRAQSAPDGLQSWLEDALLLTTARMVPETFRRSCEGDGPFKLKTAGTIKSAETWMAVVYCSKVLCGQFSEEQEFGSLVCFAAWQSARNVFACRLDVYAA